MEILSKGKDGMLKARPFDPSASSGRAPSGNLGEAPRADSDEEEEE